MTNIKLKDFALAVVVGNPAMATSSGENAQEAVTLYLAAYKKTQAYNRDNHLSDEEPTVFP